MDGDVDINWRWRLPRRLAPLAVGVSRRGGHRRASASREPRCPEPSRSGTPTAPNRRRSRRSTTSSSRRFEELHPDVDVEALAVPYDELHQKLVTAVAGGTLPDLVRSDIIWVPELGELGVLVPLDEEMPDFQTLADQTYPGALATNFWDGHYYGLPLDTNTRVLMYNAATLGSSRPRRPAGHVRRRCRPPPRRSSSRRHLRLRRQQHLGVERAAVDLERRAATSPTGRHHGDRLPQQPRVGRRRPAACRPLRAGAIPDLILGGEGGTPTSDGLATGDYATILDGPWMFPIFADQYPDFELQTAPVPAGDGGSISVVGGESVVLTQSSENKAAAAEFMRFLLSEEAQLAMAEVGQMPVLTSLGDEVTQIQDYYGVFVEQLATARPRTPTPAWPQIDDVLRPESSKRSAATSRCRKHSTPPPPRSTRCSPSTPADPTTDTPNELLAYGPPRSADGTRRTMVP